MRKIFLPLVLILITSNILNAQICNTIKCNEIKDYVNAKIVQSFLVDFIKVKSKTSKADSSNYKNLEQLFNENKLDSPLKFDKLSKSLQENKFNVTNDKLALKLNSSEIVLNQDTNRIKIANEIIDQLISSLDEGQKTKFSGLGTLRKDLVNDISNYIGSKLITTTTKLTTINEISNDPLNEKNKPLGDPNNTPSFFLLSNLNFYILLALILPIILFIIIFIRNTNYDKEQKRKFAELHEKIDTVLNRRENTGGVRQSNNINSSQTKIITKEEFDILLGRSVAFEAFQEQFEKLRRDIVDISQNKGNVSQVPKTEKNISEQNINSDIFYMTKPVENYFPIQAKSTNPSDTVYKFTIGHNRLTAEYVIHTLGAPITEIIKRSETYLVPGCTEENSTFSSAKKIETKRPGKVQLEGDKWIIIEKAIIRYV